MDDSLIVFQDKKIRRVEHAGEWYFSVVDVVGALTESPDAKDYWYRLKKRELESGSVDLSTFCRQLKLRSADGKSYMTDCADTKSMFRIIQSIPSPKAEPFKLWLAKVGYERVQEIQDPELAQRRMKEIYRSKGYSDEWIEKRVRGIAVRQELTDEWGRRDVKAGKEFAILTNEISKATFGKTVDEYKQFKGLKKEVLRDHMDDLEIIFSMLGERAATEITRVRDARGFDGCEETAKEGGEVAGNARQDIERRIGRSIISGENYLDAPENEKRKRIG